MDFTSEKRENMNGSAASVSGVTIAMYMISAIICFGLFAVPMIYFVRKRNDTLKPFLIGALAFFISQVAIRIPILQLVLPRQSWYAKLSLNLPAYALFLGFTASIFEETARYIFFRAALKKNHRYKDGIAFGFGHGGIEAVLISGFSCVSNIAMLNMINNGTFFDNLKSVSPDYAQIIYSQLISITPGLAITVGIERLIAVAMHIGLTILVLQAFNKNSIRYYWIAVAAHTFIDFTAVILQAGVPIALLETVMAFLSFCLVLYTLRARRDFAPLKEPLPEIEEGPPPSEEQ